jgi:15-cis-phytoene synthase
MTEGARARVEVGYRMAEAVTRERAKSFAFASVALNAKTRRAAFAVYAFCRRCDDAVDGGVRDGLSHDERVAELRDRVDVLRAEVRAVYAGDDGGDPVLAAFGDAVRGRGVPMEAVFGLIDGMEQDVTVTRYATWDDLLHYCELAAGTVGRMMAAIFGIRETAALAPASALGRAMQLTNVLRDVREDFVDHGRIYLPTEALSERGLGESHLAEFARREKLGEGASADAFRDLVREAATRARTLYCKADRGVPRITSSAGRACVRLMRSSYSEILTVLEARSWDPFVGRASTTTREKIRAGARAVLFPRYVGVGAS